MDAKKEKVVSLKILVDKKQNRVVFTESDKDFVDILFSFLTLPMGTIVRLVREQPGPSVIGCMNSLYAGLENLDRQQFQSSNAKANLLRPKNSSHHLCKCLKLNVDDTGPTLYQIYSMAMYLDNENVASGGGEGVFFKEKAAFMISDDLKVMPLSTSSSFELLLKLGVHDTQELEQKTIEIGLPEILSLLRLSLLSKTPLTDLFLPKHMKQLGESTVGPTIHFQSRYTKSPAPYCKKMTLKIMSRKSNRKILYAEAKEDFVDFLLSILTVPLGAVAKLLDSSPLGCIANMYKSVNGLSACTDMKNDFLKSKLLSPKVSPQFAYKIQLLDMNECFHPRELSIFQTVGIKSRTSLNLKGNEVVLNRVRSNGYIQGPATFIVSDDLTLTPLSSIAQLFLLKNLNVPISDIQEQEVSLGGEEAVRLLEAALTTTSALTNAFRLNHSKKPKIESLDFIIKYGMVRSLFLGS